RRATLCAYTTRFRSQAEAGGDGQRAEAEEVFNKDRCVEDLAVGAAHGGGVHEGGGALVVGAGRVGVEKLGAGGEDVVALGAPVAAVAAFEAEGAELDRQSVG